MEVNAITRPGNAEFRPRRSYLVLEIVNAFENASGKRVPYEFVARRRGDVAECFADPTYAFEMLGWKAELGIERMCENAWRWQFKNPFGFR